MSLDSTKHERLENHVKSAKLVLVQSAAFVLGSTLDVLREPLVEFVVVVEQTRHDEVQQRPQFCSSGNDHESLATFISRSTYLAWSSG